MSSELDRAIDAIEPVYRNNGGLLGCLSVLMETGASAVVGGILFHFINLPVDFGVVLGAGFGGLGGFAAHSVYNRLRPGNSKK